MSEEEQALFEELERESAGPAAAESTSAGTGAQTARPVSAPKASETTREPAKESISAAPRRNEPEPG